MFTLDTGLLFPETVELKKRLEDFFGFKIESLEPDLTVAEQADIHGAGTLDTQSGSVLHRPQGAAAARQADAISIAGSPACAANNPRRAAGIGIIEVYVFDEASGREIVKLNPMANWSRDAVWKYIREHRIPYNPLHDRGYRSIGCWPCTRLTANGEGERAGRWTGFNKVECGIHTFMPKKLDFQI